MSWRDEALGGGKLHVLVPHREQRLSQTVLLRERELPVRPRIHSNIDQGVDLSDSQLFGHLEIIQQHL